MRVICLSLLAVLSALPAAAAPIRFVDATYRVNHPLDPAPFSWAVSDVGWVWTPTETFLLTSWHTRFLRGGDPRVITAEIWDAPPTAGGHLLARDEAESGFMGAVYHLPFPFLELVKGEDYFFGFQNVAGFGVNVTNEPGAVALGTFYYSFDGAGDYGLSDASPGFVGQPILTFFGLRVVAVPEPALSVLLLIGAGAIIRRRRRRWTNGPPSR